MNVCTGSYSTEISWTLVNDDGTGESCSSPNYYSSNYACSYSASPTLNTYTGCGTMKKGNYRLYCRDSYGDGWNYAYVIIPESHDPTEKWCQSFRNGYSYVEHLMIV